jgi:uncharacterized protein (TIRG00374 family)
MNKKRLMTILRFVISVILLIIVVKLADLQNIVKVLQNFNQIWLLPIFLFITLSVLISAIKWNTLLKAQGIHVKILTLFQYYNCGLFFNNFLPSSIGGDGIRILLTGQKTENYSAATASVIMERTIATVSLAFLGLFSSVFAMHPSQIAVILMLVIFIAGIVMAFVLISGWVPRRLRNRDGKISKAWVSFAASAKELQGQKKQLLLCFIQSLLFQVVVALVIGAIIRGLGQPELRLPDLILVTSASSVLAMVPLGLNGYGMREGSYIYLLKPFGYTSSQAVTVSILFAFFVTLYSLIGGVNWLIINKPIQKSAKGIKGNLST